MKKDIKKSVEAEYIYFYIYKSNPDRWKAHHSLINKASIKYFKFSNLVLIINIILNITM